MKRAMVYNIQHFSLHDGPGIRTTIFLKGCSLHCAWCHNPESISSQMQILFDAQKCIGCGACAKVCRAGAQQMEEQSIHRYEAAKCVQCGACTEVCYAGAMERCGQWKSQSELLEEGIRDRQLYENSGGGVTFSGGEPLLQAEFLREICMEFKQEGIHVAIDTALQVPWEAVDSVLPYADLFLVDYKVDDSELHQKYTGAGNDRILQNLSRLAEKKPIYIRIPVIGGVNDNEENMRQTAAFLQALGGSVKQVDLLSYHDLGIQKSAKLGKRMQRFITPDAQQMQRLVQCFSELGVEVLID